MLKFVQNISNLLGKIVERFLPQKFPNVCGTFMMRRWTPAHMWHSLACLPLHSSTIVLWIIWEWLRVASS